MATAMTTNEEFKQIKLEHNLTAKQCAEILGCPLQTVKCWLKSPHVSSHRATPVMALRLLRMATDSQKSSESLSV